MSKCLITVDGGMGKNVMFTSILPVIKEKYDEVYVLSGYFDIFKACPYVTDAFPYGQSNLYQDIALDEDCDIFWRDPYNNPKFIKKQIHLFDAWLEELGFEPRGTEWCMQQTAHLENLHKFCPTIDADIAKLIQPGEKYMIVQFCGGQSPLRMPGQEVPKYDDRVEGIKRNYHDAQELINKLHETYPGEKIIHFALDNEPSYVHAIKLGMIPYLYYHELAKNATRIVCTDSSLQHLSAGANNNVTVIWGETRPEHFGYSCNKNICAKNVKNTQPYFRPLGASPAIVRFPTVDEVMEVIGG